MRTPEHDQAPQSVLQVGDRAVHIFGAGGMHRDEKTIASFGAEWEKFNLFDAAEIERTGNEYFDVVPTEVLGPEVVAMDLGCGSGRWTRYLSSRVGHIEAVDPSEAVFHAARVHGDLANVRWNQAGVDTIPFRDGTFDLVVCLGVLHHVPDTAGAIAKLATKLKPGGHMLLYLYYALDGRGPLFKGLFHLSNVFRRVIAAMPAAPKRIVCDLIAFTVYLPARTVIRMARAVDPKGSWWHKLPLSYYHNKSLTILRNDALDRFGTPLEQRFTQEQMRVMMQKAGITDIRFSPNAPYWHAIGRRG